MSFQLFPPLSNFISLLCFLSVFLVKILPFLANPELIRSCSLPFRCGNITASYPFWGGDRPYDCGQPSLRLTCEKDHTTFLMIGDNIKYRVLKVDQKEQVLKIARQEYLEGSCPHNNITFDTAIFDIATGYKMFKLIYGCPVSGNFTCNMKDVVSYMDGFIQFKSGVTIPDCNISVDVPVSESFLAEKGGKLALQKTLEEGFELKWKLLGCEESCSSCGYDFWSSSGICYCADGQHSSLPGICSPKSKGSFNLNLAEKVAIGAMAGVVGIVAVSALFYMHRKNIFFRKKLSQNDQDVEAVIRKYGSLAPKRYNYSDVKKMTKSFTDKIGQGGYGVVYRGKLHDGRVVAVKILSDQSKGNGEEFINEVACISGTSHVNIVTLLGFCSEGNKRALIYEFMSNGSLDKFIHDKGSLSTNNNHLEWETLSQIVVGVARGLEYLHRGCNTRIVHFDIKPHNILLDEDFCPKISDFGLAKLCKKKESIISMLDARGTIGYIAPEVFCRSFGGVSHKSDVYGFGMMILEMLGVRNNSIASGVTNASSEMYFPEWIYKLLEPGEDLTLHGIVSEEEEVIARKMIIVSLWCIQTNPSDRPSISKAVEMLEGGLESLQVPPKPFLNSSFRISIQHSSMTTTSLS